MANALKVYSIVSFVVAGLFGLISIILYFFLNIKEVIGDLSGFTAKKSIEQLRKNNENVDRKYNIMGIANYDKDKLTEKLRKTNQSNNLVVENSTVLLNDEKLIEKCENDTVLLNDDKCVGKCGKDTDFLNDGEETDLLISFEAKIELDIIEEVVVIHTEEKITI